MFVEDELNQQYPTLAAYSSPLKAAEREIVGRDNEINQLLASMARPELRNALLLGPAGSGKTALVQGCSLIDVDRTYREVDLARMVADLSNPDEMAARLKVFFDEAEAYGKDESRDLVLFIDEIHLIVQLNDAAVEALKPILGASGARGLRIVGATTYDEYYQFLEPNQPLKERLQTIKLPELDKKTTISILRGMAKRYDADLTLLDDHLYEMIYEYTNRYVPASSQPRKSILVLDSMIGWHRQFGRSMDRALLADVIYESVGANVAFRVDATKIQQKLDEKVFSQKLATSVVSRRLQLCVADLNDKSRPMSSFLFTGSTGVGKQCVDSTPVPVYTPDGSVSWKNHGDLTQGDMVFGRDGSPIRVLGYFPQGEQDVYRVTLTDGRHLDVGGPHLWSVYTDGSDDLQTLTTLELIDQGASGFSIPLNEPVEWPAREFATSPYDFASNMDVVGRIPEEYLSGSMAQRDDFLDGLTQSRAVIPTHREDYALSSLRVWHKGLMEDVRHLLFSLGISNSVVCENGFFTITLHLGVDTIGISSIEKLLHQESSSCIYVDHPEHLYQAGQFVVTHNTELAKTLAQLLFGDTQRSFIRFDMSEYSQDDSVERFRHELTQQVKSYPFSVILLDEIEKSAATVTRVLLQVLDDGRLSDSNRLPVSFVNSYIILTTNAASEIYKVMAQYDASDDGAGKNMRHYMGQIRNSITATAGSNKFPPELLGRLDAIVPFQPLTRNTQEKIVRSRLAKLRRELMTKHNVSIEIDAKVLQYLIEDNAETESDAGGARAAIQTMNDDVVAEIATFINANPHKKKIRVDVEGELVSDNKNRKESSAHIVVSPSR